MSTYTLHDPAALLAANAYPGRGIIAGLTPDGKTAVAAYFIMGRSQNSRNRIFCERDNGDVYTCAFDESLLSDPSLIIYNAVRALPNKLIVTNGDQTDTVYDGLVDGKSFAASLACREFEPDAPNLTPRISLLQEFAGGYTYSMSILKSADAAGTGCNRYTFDYTPIAGTGHFIHTYDHDGDPLPTFSGEPERVSIDGDIDAFTAALWDNLNTDNKISLFVQYTDLATGKTERCILNRHK